MHFYLNALELVTGVGHVQGKQDSSKVGSRSDRGVSGGSGAASRISFEPLLVVTVMDRFTREVRQDSSMDYDTSS